MRAAKNRNLFSSCLVCLILIGLCHAGVGLAESPDSSDQWRRFRGPEVAGISNETRVFDELGSVGLSVTWKSELGSGYSGIAIAEGKAVTMFSRGESDVMAAFDTADGRELWAYTLGPVYKGYDGSHDGPITTPLIEDGQVFSLSPRGKLFAVALETGKEIWSIDLVEKHQIEKPYYGFATSPILEAGVLIVELGGEEKAVGGFDPATGELRWASGTDRVSYQSPVPIELEGKRQIVAAASSDLFGIDPGSGEVLWQQAHGGEGGPGSESLVPVPAGGGRMFLSHKADGSVMVKLQKEEDTAFAVLWESRSIRNTYNVPVYYQGHIYSFSSRFLTCVDAETGETRWRSRQPGDGFLILVDGRLVIMTKKGGVHIAEASPEGYVEVAGRPVFDDHSWTVPSFAGGSIYARSMGEIARIDLTGGVTRQEVRVAARGAGGSLFGRFLAEVDEAEGSAKKAVVDRYLKAQKSFPIVEGRNRVHFVYRGEAKDVALAGDMFGARREEPMTRVPGTDLFYYSLELASDARLNYLFIKDYEEIRDPRNPRETVSELLTKEMEMSFAGDLELSWFSMPEWSKPRHLEEAPEGSRGRIARHKVKSDALPEGEAEVNVYLPPGYDASAEKRYPVIYVHGGPLAREMGSLPNSLDNLIGKSVEPLIAVFMTIEGLRGPPYFEVFTGAVIPLVDQNYRTIEEPRGRANVGSGFSAYNAVLATLSRPDLFSKVAAQSVFMFSSMEAFLYPLVDGLGENVPQVYLEWGTYDFRNPHEAWNMVTVNRELARRLREKNVELAGGEVSDSTGWASWRNRTDRVFEALYPLE